MLCPMLVGFLKWSNSNLKVIFLFQRFLVITVLQRLIVTISSISVCEHLLFVQYKTITKKFAKYNIFFVDFKFFSKIKRFF